MGSDRVQIDPGTVTRILSSPLVSLKFKTILQRIIEADQVLLFEKHEYADPVMETDKELIQMLETWYADPSDEELRISE